MMMNELIVGLILSFNFYLDVKITKKSEIDLIHLRYIIKKIWNLQNNVMKVEHFQLCSTFHSNFRKQISFCLVC